MTTKDFDMSFFNRNPFSRTARKEFQEKWSSMTDSEKLEMMNKRMESFSQERRHEAFTIEHIDAHCKEWLEKTSEEKQALLNKRKEMFKNRLRNFHQEDCKHWMFGFGDIENNFEKK